MIFICVGTYSNRVHVKRTHGLGYLGLCHGQVSVPTSLTRFSPPTSQIISAHTVSVSAMILLAWTHPSAELLHDLHIGDVASRLYQV
jgi:hypothetical protein